MDPSSSHASHKKDTLGTRNRTLASLGLITRRLPLVGLLSASFTKVLNPKLDTVIMASCVQPGVLKVHPDVAAALKEGRPVVALESTIISHGMPYPQNLQTAQEVEAVVRAGGAVPATIAIIGGQPCIGLDASQLEHVAKSGTAVTKVSRRDLAAVMARGADGATTVSATMLLAAAAGIKVFVTGGVGGVHRGGEVTWDVSADLTEMGRTPVMVVCAGAKSVLDIPRTLEYLETQGVAVAAYGTNEFPAFFTPRSGCAAPSRVDTPQQAAAMIASSHALGLTSGMVVAVPIPAQDAAEGAMVEEAIKTSLREADEQGITGNKITPFLLERIRSLTHGASLASNIKLVKNNARVGSAIAVEHARLVAAHGGCGWAAAGRSRL